MADTKISALPAATVPLAGTEVLPIVQSSTTKQVSVANLTAGRAISASSVTNAALTATRVTYAGTSGVLTDNANFIFDTSNNLLIHASSTDPYASSSGYGIALNGSADYFAMARSNGAAMYVARQTSNGALAEWWCQGNSVGSIAVTTLATTYNTLSDYRLKENVTPMTGALNKIAQLKPVNYKWKSNKSNGQGFIAHELQAVVPDCVSGEKDAIDENGKPKYQGIDTSFLVATLTAAIQEQQALIESLTTRLTALENK